MGGAAGAGMLAGGTQILAGKLEADAIEAQGAWENRAAKFSADNLALQRKEVSDIAQEDIFLRQQEVRQMLGMQRAQLAASGVEVGADTALQLQEDTKRMGQEDVMNIENNAWRQAWGLKIQETDTRNRGKFALASSKQKSFATIATAGLKGIGSFADGTYK